MSVLLGGERASKIGHGLMFMTWRPGPVPDAQCFPAIKDSIDSQPPGVKAFLNAGEYYGFNLAPTNLELVQRFFSRYPELADKAFLSVKGGLKAGSMTEGDGSEENVRKSVDNILAKLGGTKRLDLYQNGRVDRTRPIEDQIQVLAKLVREGRFDHIGLSEVNEEELRRAHAVHPIAAIEVQVSPVHYPEEIQAVIKAAKELGVAVVAYSPIGHGVLSNTRIDPNSFPEGDMRRGHPALQDESMRQIKPVLDALSAFASKKSITIAQAAIAWVAARGEHVMPLPGSSAVQRTQENRAAGDIVISEEELEVLDAAVGSRRFDV